MPFIFEETDLEGVIRVIPKVFGDDRGVFWESYKRSEFEANGISARLVQDNVSISVKNVLRGLHFQRNPAAQGKLVQAVVGEVFDVAVDIRPASPSFGKWTGITLNETNRELFYIPPGFAHGFAVLSDRAVFSYKVTAEYAPEAEAGIMWSDPDIGIEWPMNDPLLSEKDMALPLLKDVVCD